MAEETFRIPYNHLASALIDHHEHNASWRVTDAVPEYVRGVLDPYMRGLIANECAELGVEWPEDAEEAFEQESFRFWAELSWLLRSLSALGVTSGTKAKAVSEALVTFFEVLPHMCGLYLDYVEETA